MRTQFVRDSWRLMKRCTKPDRTGAPAVIFAQSEFCAAVLRLAALFYSIISFAELSLCLSAASLSLAEFSKIAQATATGFAIMGFIGFFVKLIFIPINNIIGAPAPRVAPRAARRRPDHLPHGAAWLTARCMRARASAVGMG